MKKSWIFILFLLTFIYWAFPEPVLSSSCVWKPNSAWGFSISAIGPSDIWSGGAGAVGGTKLRHWDGTQWSDVFIPLPQETTHGASVSATADDDLWAAGIYKDSSGNPQPYVLHFNGVEWSLHLIPSDNPLEGDRVLLRAFASTDVWAVGAFRSGGLGVYVGEHWNGSTWTQVQFRHPIINGKQSTDFEIDGIGGSSGSDVWAVGRVPGLKPLIEHFDGRAWTIVHNPSIGPSGASVEPAAIFAGSPTDAWLVGLYFSRQVMGRFGPAARTYAAHWNGQVWSYVPTPNFDWPSLNIDNYLLGVSASSPNDAWAVGSVGSDEGVGELAMHWDGQNWSTQERPPKMGAGALFAVADLSANDVWAVGINNAEFWCSPSH
jgi:hypothetical protein